MVPISPPGGTQACPRQNDLSGGHTKRQIRAAVGIYLILYVSNALVIDVSFNSLVIIYQ